MHKALLILGLLRHGPLYGYELNRIVRAHGELYADLKKANLYYRLDRLAQDGFLTVAAEPGTRGARGERLIYELTEQGQAHFHKLLREVLLTYETVHSGIEVAVVFLQLLPVKEAIALLNERWQIVDNYRQKTTAELGAVAADNTLAAIASDHMLSLIDAELAWIDRSLARLEAEPWSDQAQRHQPSEAEGDWDV